MPIPRLFRSLLPRLLSIPQIDPNRLDFELKIENQAQDLWCWAAVGVAVARYFGSTETQCALAAKVKNVATCCSLNDEPNACNEPDLTEEALRKAGRNHYSPRNPPTLAFLEALVEERRGQRPVVCVMKAWRVKGADISYHAIVVQGTLSMNGINYVKYLDPWGPVMDEMPVDDFMKRLDRFILTN